MPTLVPLVMREHNDEVIRMTIVPDDPSESLLSVSQLLVYLKDDACTSDSATSTVVLSTVDPTEVVIISQTAAQIVAEAFIPSATIATPYPRIWRVDVYIGAFHRTALYGPVTITAM